jgi:group I intron endonuclease
MKSGVYCITNKVNGRKYYGSSVNIHKRWREHRSALRNGKHENPHLQHAWIKYGEDAFDFGVVGYCEEEYLLDMEQVYLDSNPNGYNICPLARSRIGKPVSEETRRKIGEKSKGRKHSEESRQKMRDSHRINKCNIGRKHSQESIAKMRKAKQGKVFTLEHRRKIAESQIGRKHSEETRSKMSESQKRRWDEKKEI